MNILRTASLGSNFTGFYIKRSVQRYINVWLLNKNISYEFEEIYWDSKNYIATLFGNWIWDNIYWWGYELNFDKSSLHYNAKKKLYAKASLIWL